VLLYPGAHVEENPVYLRRDRLGRASAWALALLLFLTAAHGALAQPARAAGEALPDLVADPPRWPYLEQYTSGSDTRLLLRFDGFIHNIGAGAAELQGSARDGTLMTSVAQRVYRTDGTWADEASPDAHIQFEPEDGHDHWHLRAAARYSLWDWNQAAEVAPAMKVGFCFEDSERVETSGPAAAVYSNGAIRFCEHHNPNVAGVFMGVSAGWRDIYDSGLAFQWVDASDVSPGRYWLHAQVDPNNIVRESNEQNDPAVSEQAPIVPGYVAQPLTRQGIEAGAPVDLTLETDSWGSPGTRQMRIESPPAHGTLSVASGEWFSDAGITYTPDAGYSGADSFSFSARDSSSPFPLHPVVATAALGVQRSQQAVAISGAPSQLYTGTSAQLSASVATGSQQVGWSVDGVPGGNASLGTIDASGVYSAPATPPPGGAVRIRATGSSGAFAEVQVTVVTAPPKVPAPGTGDPTDPNGPVLTPLLSVPLVSVHGRTITTSAVPGRSGVVETSARVGARHIALCRTKTPARRRVSCRLSVPQRYRVKSVVLVVKLRVGSRVLATRRAAVTKAH
jgi:hypothetical protein